jgi:very-short-patch-repair endonuclease
MKNKVPSKGITLRTRMTNEEGMLWSRIKNEKFNKVKFRKQFIVEDYVIDFYAPKYKLAIELDGASHFTDKGIIKDTERDKYLNEQGIEVLRFENESVAKNLTTVLNLIYTKIKEIEAKFNDEPNQDLSDK